MGGEGMRKKAPALASEAISRLIADPSMVAVDVLSQSAYNAEMNAYARAARIAEEYEEAGCMPVASMIGEIADEIYKAVGQAVMGNTPFCRVSLVTIILEAMERARQGAKA